MALRAKRLNIWPRKVLVSEDAHLRWNRIGFVFVRQVAGVGETGENVVSSEPGVVRQNLALGLAGREEFEDEFYGKTGSTDHRFASQDLGINDDTLRKRHIHGLACQPIPGLCLGIGKGTQSPKIPSIHP